MASSAIWIVAFALFSISAAQQCQTTSNVEQKQVQLTEIINSVNKPYVPLPKIEENLSPEEQELFRSKIGFLDKREVYSVFDSRYWQEANASLHYLLAPPTYEGFVRAASILRRHINEDLFYYVFSVATTHRTDTQGVVLPRVHDVYPDKFFHTHVISQIKEASIGGQKNIVIDDTHSQYDYRDPYSHLRYFLEDIALNSHHYHWHVQNTLLWHNKTFPSTPQARKDRYGESFYYMHHQMVNRFDAELLSNHLPRVTPFENWNDPIPEGYAPHLTVDRYQYRYQFRPANLKLQDLPEMTRNQMRHWRDQVLYTIHVGKIRSRDGHNVSLNNDEGIDFLGHLLEPTFESLNHVLYGSLHSYAHVIAARAADPTHKYGEDYGAMYDVATSLRDPIFFRWHKYIDDIFEEYKHTRPAYTQQELSWNDVQVSGVSVDGAKLNKIITYLEEEIVPVGTGFSFSGNVPSKIKIRHLNHEDFTYNIQVVNNAGGPKKAVVRIFLAPRYDERGHQLDFDEQRRSVIELDKFVTDLNPGNNDVQRKSSDSSVTQDHRNIYAAPSARQQDDHCHCGWPDHLLIPRGSSEGTAFDVFVVVTDYEKDIVTNEAGCPCGDGVSYCGYLYGKVSDRRPMGYPFDRHTNARNFGEFKTSNMHSTEIRIRFGDQVKTIS